MEPESRCLTALRPDHDNWKSAANYGLAW